MTDEELIERLTAMAEALTVVAESTPSLEDLLFSIAFPCWRNGVAEFTSSNRRVLMAAPMPMRILSVAFVSEYGSVPASDSRGWELSLEHGTAAAGFPDFAVKSTRITGPTAAGAITARTPWTFDSAGDTWDMAAGELLTVNCAPYGTAPPALEAPAVFTVRYRPL